MAKLHRAVDVGATLPPVLLVGNPNVGKSVLFGVLTGRYANVSNYPGTTIEVTRGRMNAARGGFDLIDTPGTNHLIPMSEDERVTRDILLNEPEAAVLQVGDAKNLRRTLSLTLELALMGRPVVLALNMMDEARSLGIRLHRAQLEQRLGIPVVETVAIRHTGLGALQDALGSGRAPRIEVQYPAAIERAIQEISTCLPETGASRRYIAICLLSGDRTILPWLRQRMNQRQIEACDAVRLAAGRASGEPLSQTILRAHLEIVDEIISECYISADRPRAGWTHRLGRWSIHPVRGVAILALVLLATFWFVGLFGAGTLVDLMETGLFGQVLSPAVIDVTDALFPFPHTHPPTDVTVNLQIPLSPAHGLDTGIEWTRSVSTPEYAVDAPLSGWQRLFRLIHDLLVGPYGIFTMALAYGFAIVLPIVFTFFILFSILEDTGYLPRLAVMVNDFFRLMGLNGRAVLPMVLGLGCDTMATLTTRILQTRKQRLIVTLLLALGVPCSAQLGVLLAMMSVVSPGGTIIWLGAVTLIMVTVGWLSSRLFPGRSSDFLLEIPPIRRPVLSNIAVKTIARIEWYLREVLPLFVLGTLILFVLDRTGALPGIRDAAAPLVRGWLGLPGEATDAFLIGFLRRDYGAVFLLEAATGPDAILTGNQVLVSMLIITLFVPCIANVFMILKEHGWRITAAMVAFIFPFAFFVGGLLMRFLRVAGLEV